MLVSNSHDWRNKHEPDICIHGDERDISFSVYLLTVSICPSNTWQNNESNNWCCFSFSSTLWREVGVIKFEAYLKKTQKWKKTGSGKTNLHVFSNVTEPFSSTRQPTTTLWCFRSVRPSVCLYVFHNLIFTSCLTYSTQGTVITIDMCIPWVKHLKMMSRLTTTWPAVQDTQYECTKSTAFHNHILCQTEISCEMCFKVKVKSKND